MKEVIRMGNCYLYYDIFRFFGVGSIMFNFSRKNIYIGFSIVRRVIAEILV